MVINPDFNIGEILLSTLGYPETAFRATGPLTGKGKPGNDDFIYGNRNETLKTVSEYGTPLRKKDASGRWYFMPVTLIHKDEAYEIPNAVISFTGKKTIVETPMVGRQGSVKELIGLDDYEIGVQGVALSDDFPQEALERLHELYTINESVSLQCALTDVFLDKDDKVIIRSVELSDMHGTESFVTIKISLVTDRSFELKIE